mmetsp:Transcript_72096/g.167085  ORF Transcript_72096/g.167085 Transcript_72096/m.167085 type:complete len:296 (-) Transcript_72096:174-1061(-)
MALAAAASSLTLAAAQKSASNAPQPGGSWTLQAGREVCPMGNQGDQGKQVCQGAHAMQLVELRLQLLVDRRVFEALVVPVITLKHHSCGLWLQVEQIHECEDKRSNRGTHGQAQSPSREDHNSSAQGAQLEVLWKELGLQGAKLLPREILEHGQACYEGGPDVGPKPDAIGGEVDHARGRHDLPSADSAQRQHQAAEEGPVPQRRSHKLSRVVQLPYHGLLRVQLTQGPVSCRGSPQRRTRAPLANAHCHSCSCQRDQPCTFPRAAGRVDCIHGQPRGPLLRFSSSEKGSGWGRQ